MAKRGGFPGGMPGNMNNLMKQAQRMQRQMEEKQKELEEKQYSASAGGGAVTVTVSGKKCDAGKGQSGSSCTVHRDSGAGWHRHVLHDFKPEPGADDLETERT